MEIINKSENIGSDGAVAVEKLSVENGNLIGDISVSFPISKLLGPVNDAIDKGIDSAEAAIPGDWDKAILEPIRIAIKAEIVNLLGKV